jgi:DNA-binding response OmpR family regulator
MGSATVLVVDDERKIRDLVRAYLERDGYAVLLADSGQMALQVAARVRPDLVVLDLMLPDLAGEEVARSLRAISEVPIVMLTAKATEEDRVAGLRMGADDYLVKPFSPRELAARVEAVLRRARGGGRRHEAVVGPRAAGDRPRGAGGLPGRRDAVAHPQRVRPGACACDPTRPGVVPLRAGDQGAGLRL